MSYTTAYDRWAGIGPYYAMFPIQFANRVIITFTRPRQWILDPFAGRASSVFAGAAHSRPSIGIEINPVGWIYGKTKITPAPKEKVKVRLSEILQMTETFPDDSGSDLPAFFHYCFAPNVLRFLVAARAHLNWRQSATDRTLMALILVDLHGVRERSFSNQMRQSRAMSPDYSIRWWKSHRSKPPQIELTEFLEKKIEWRYAKGVPEVAHSKVFLGDSSKLIDKVFERVDKSIKKPFRLLFTSPPYMGISDYHRDQWLRLWMLGNEPVYARSTEKYRGTFSSPEEYKTLLSSVFSSASDMMSRSGYVYVRTSTRKPTFETTHDVLQTCFPRWQMRIIRRPYKKETQTALYGDKSRKPGEVDIILSGPQAT